MLRCYHLWLTFALGTAFREVKSEALHPSVGMKKPGEHVRTNFGQQPFVFDIDGLVAVSHNYSAPYSYKSSLND